MAQHSRFCASRVHQPCGVSAFAMLCQGKSQKQGEITPPFTTEGSKEAPETICFILRISCETEPCSGAWKSSTIFCAENTQGVPAEQ